jgi:hypothetical protein
MNNPIDKFEDELRKEAALLLLGIGVFIRDKHRKDLSKQNLDGKTPSRPGEFPRRVTGNLIEETIYTPTTLREIERTLTVSIGYTRKAKYGEYLSRRGRLSIEDTVKKYLPQLERAQVTYAGF